MRPLRSPCDDFEIRARAICRSCGKTRKLGLSSSAAPKQFIRGQDQRRPSIPTPVLFHQPPTIPSPRASAYGLSVHIGGLMRVNLTACERVKMCWGAPRAARRHAPGCIRSSGRKRVAGEKQGQRPRLLQLLRRYNRVNSKCYKTALGKSAKLAI
jgi:hypothetical protein